MVETRLELVNEQDTNSPSTTIGNNNVPVFENISVPIDFQIADIREIGSGSGSHSYTIQIPGSKEVNIFFENVYDVNISLQTFNPNLKVKAYYYVNDLLNFEGHLQILSINVDEIKKEVVYECNIIGEVITFFSIIKDRFLTDLDFSLYNHDLTYAFISGSFANTGSNKAYPIINWGKTNGNLSTLTPKDFRLCLFAREYLAKIFSNAGYTWTSTFLDSSFFKRLIVPPTTNYPTLSTTVINNNKFQYTANGTELVYNGVSLSYSLGLITYNNTTGVDINFQNLVYDSAGLFVTPNFTPTSVNQYNTNANIGLTIQIFKGASDISSSTTGLSGYFDILLYKGSAVVASSSVDITSVTFGSSAVNYANISLPNTYLAVGTPYHLKIFARNINAIVPISAGTYTMNVTVANGSNFSSEFSTNEVFENSPVNCNDAIPPNVKQGEFVSWIFKRFNLFCQVDKTNPNNLIIEDRPNFYLTTARDWSAKHDTGSGVKVIPMGELDFNKITFTDKEDGDYYNKQYKEEYAEVYGTHREDVENDFIKNEKVITTGFSATPYSVSNSNNLVTATILDKKNNNIIPINSNLRLLYYKVITLPNSQWTFSYAYPSSGAVTYTTYPHAGHTDNPYAPTLDLNWGIPKKIYFTYPNQTWTTNNVYNKYYSQYFDQITDKNSKIIKTRFFLNENDIHIFDFRYPVFAIINDEQGYYLVNKIEQYNPTQSQSTMVELLKLVDYPIFTPTTYDMSAGLGSGNQGWERVYGDNITKGTDNTNWGSNSMIVGGSGNFIANG